jgi:hypothetical protein
MGMVELIRERDSLFKRVHIEGTASTAWPRIDEIDREMIDIVSRSCSSVVQTVVSHGDTTLIIDPWKNRVENAIERSALFIDSMLDPYGKVDRNAQTTEIADFAELEVAF